MTRRINISVLGLSLVMPLVACNAPLYVTVSQPEFMQVESVRIDPEVTGLWETRFSWRGILIYVRSMSVETSDTAMMQATSKFSKPEISVEIVPSQSVLHLKPSGFLEENGRGNYRGGISFSGGVCGSSESDRWAPTNPNSTEFVLSTLNNYEGRKLPISQRGGYCLIFKYKELDVRQNYTLEVGEFLIEDSNKVSNIIVVFKPKLIELHGH